MNEYTVHALDNEGSELRYDWGITSIKKAIKRAREFLADSELIDAELNKVEVRDKNGEVEWDNFVL